MPALTALPEPDLEIRADDDEHSSTGPPMYTPWASAGEETAGPCADPSSDVIPELMLELL